MEDARIIFADTNFKITNVSRVLGSLIGDSSLWSDYALASLRKYTSMFGETLIICAHTTARRLQLLKQSRPTETGVPKSNNALLKPTAWQALKQHWMRNLYQPWTFSNTGIELFGVITPYPCAWVLWIQLIRLQVHKIGPKAIGLSNPLSNHDRMQSKFSFLKQNKKLPN